MYGLNKYRVRQGIIRRFNALISLLRVCRYRLSGASIGRGCTMKGNISFLYGWRTRIGNHCEIDDFVEFKCPTSQSNDTMYNIILDEHVFIGRGTIIDSNLSIIIGKDTFVAPYCFITDNSHKFNDWEIPIRMQGYDYKAVKIDADVWIGAHVVVVAGVSIGRGSIIGANSTVTHDIPPDVIACGSPAIVIKSRS